MSAIDVNINIVNPDDEETTDGQLIEQDDTQD